jgi:hypothetical protein
MLRILLRKTRSCRLPTDLTFSILNSRWSIPFRRRCISLVLIALVLTNAGVAPAFERHKLSRADDSFLEDLSHRAFSYFWEQANPNTGLVFDRARADASAMDEAHRDVASIAATGFGLTALCIAAERHWVGERDARDRARATLRFFAERAANFHGWFYHWMDARTGERQWNSEVSSIDTALLLAGVLTARQAFRDHAELVRLATKIFERVDFQWMQNGHPAFLTHGWKPESGFLRSLWNDYSEETMLYLLAIGSQAHSITPRAWQVWRRDWISYAGYSYLAGAQPLFIHQYSQAWVDYRGRRESQPPYVDYFDNSIKATRAHRAFCIDLSKEFPGYSEDIWGITASDSAGGYVAWGGPPRDPAIDGTVVPSAAGGSLMFTPDICLPALRAMRDKFGERVWGRYGFVDAFNPNTGWVDPDVIGINVGITLLSAENLRSGNVWRWFMRNAEVMRAMRLVGLAKVGSDRRRKLERVAIRRTPVLSSRQFGGLLMRGDSATDLEKLGARTTSEEWSASPCSRIDVKLHTSRSGCYCGPRKDGQIE